MINSKICNMLGITYPIFQGGMAHISDGKLAAAVSEAGGLGIISAASGDVEYVKNQIDIASSLTKKPIGINVMLMGNNVEEIAKMISQSKVSVVTTGAGNPEKYVPMWKEAGIKVIPVVPSCALAKLCERSGVDAIIAEGGESGGHVGDLTTMALIPQVCDAVSIPVIAAGGIADGRGAAAAFMLGAQGIQIGTRFLTATECSINQNYKNKVLKANDTATIVTGKRLGHPVRSIKTPFSRAYSKAEYTNIPDDELEAMAVGTLRAAVVDGDDKKGCFLAGQIAGMVNKEQNVKDIITEIFDEAEILLNGAKKWVK
ncbi:MAG: nitronate monooxygenase [Clostridia bacterium]|nr:nitronate monooxygenase [Clostridia bacterium]